MRIQRIQSQKVVVRWESVSKVKSGTNGGFGGDVRCKGGPAGGGVQIRPAEALVGEIRPALFQDQSGAGPPFLRLPKALQGQAAELNFASAQQRGLGG
jgi:hypothetical protein